MSTRNIFINLQKKQMNENLELIACLYCNSKEYRTWAIHNGFNAVQCSNCGFVYVNPRPKLEAIDQAVLTGTHSEDANNLNVITRPIKAKVSIYSKIFKSFYAETFKDQKPIAWLDVGAGFGEILQAVNLVAPKDSIVKGIEPMEPKALHAQKNGLNVQFGYLDAVEGKYDVVSIIDVFSHIPDFRDFLKDIKAKLNPKGEIFIETGNAADIDRKFIPGDLSLPDHLTFAGEKHVTGFLKEQGFEIIKIERVRTDHLLGFIKDIVKKIIGRPVNIVLPYTSGYRSLLIRAKLK